MARWSTTLLAALLLAAAAGRTQDEMSFPAGDREGIPDSRDKCPDRPEDHDVFQDLDGCPDPDNDRDGVPDRCPNQPEDRNSSLENDDGCPDPDNGFEDAACADHAPSARQRRPTPRGGAPQGRHGGRARRLLPRNARR